MRLRTLPCLLMITALAGTTAFAADGVPPATVKPLLNKDLVGAAGKELILLTVDYLPGGSSMPHRHDAQVFVYVLEGEVTMQVKGGPLQSLHAGDTFYENPQDVHEVSANASSKSPAKLLVFMVKDKGAAATKPAS